MPARESDGGGSLPMEKSLRRALIQRTISYYLTYFTINPAPKDSIRGDEFAQQAPRKHSHDHYANKIIATVSFHVHVILIARFSIIILTHLCKEYLIPILEVVERHVPVGAVRTAQSTLQALEHFNPNPIQYMGISSVEFFVFLVLQLAYFMLYLRQVHKHTRSNILVVRLLLNYPCELARIDYLIRDYLRNILSRLTQINKSLKGDNSASISRRALLENHSSLSIHRVVHELDKYSENPIQLRPDAFSLDWLQKLEKIYTVILIVSIFLAGSVNIGMSVFMLRTSMKGKCLLMREDPCRWSGVFTVFETAASLEYIVAVYVLNVVIGYNTFVYVASMVSQYRSMKDIAGDIEECLRELWLFNGLNEIPLAARSGYNALAFDELDNLLLKTTIRMAMSQKERDASALASSKAIKSMMIIYGPCILISLKIAFSSLHERTTFSVIFFPILFLCNLVLLAGGYLHTLELKLAKRTWYVQAELVLRRARQWPVPAASTQFIQARWSELACIEDSGDIQHETNLFGLNLTYGTLIRFNFYVLSFAAWLSSRPSIFA